MPDPLHWRSFFAIPYALRCLLLDGLFLGLWEQRSLMSLLVQIFNWHFYRHAGWDGLKLVVPERDAYQACHSYYKKQVLVSSADLTFQLPGCERRSITYVPNVVTLFEFGGSFPQYMLF